MRHVIISGRVQKVGYRQWCVTEATRRGLKGWVRNRTDDTVEAVFAGPAQAVAAMLEACRKGPRPARVDKIQVEEATEAALAAGRSDRFEMLSTP